MSNVHSFTFNSGELQPIEATAGNKLQITVKKRHAAVIDFEDVNFRTDHVILMPDSQAVTEVEFDFRRVSGLAVVKAVLDFVQSGSVKLHLVAGHTDSKGSSSHNLELSEERARNVYLYLSGQRDKWAAHCQEHFEVDDIQQILKWLSSTFGWGCDPGPIDNDLGPSTRRALDEYRDNNNKQFGVSLRKGSQVDEKDWRAYFDLYETELARILGCDVPELRIRRKQLHFVDPPILACGEHWPKKCPHSSLGGADHRPEKCPDADGFESATNRRVELLFFELLELPRIEGVEPPGRDIYGPERFLFRFLPVREEQVSRRTFMLRLFDEKQRPVPNAPYELTVAGKTQPGVADGSGFLKASVEEIPEKCTVRWNRTSRKVESGQAEKSFDFEVEVFIDLEKAEESEAMRRRLHNLGYPATIPMIDNLKAFQRDHGLKVTGELNDVRDLILKWHDSAEPEDLQVQSKNKTGAS